jgi:hypothetical protein
MGKGRVCDGDTGHDSLGTRGREELHDSNSDSDSAVWGGGTVSAGWQGEVVIPS